ncbi:hypothetical protein BC777_3759 [Yoonia maricola]|uniref:Transferrin-binding protein B C-lobe/N-lobe beta barrel domain-containing protein n=1 Tax=Yoonia maricola TaxID=420999 RepID=A0A2M8W1C6_9RHOB|nr:hypothetical protein [Yoonia maricola]PJI84698.1 hypothetical protein BC777_3759 [Yoonia maricola]
MTRITLSIITLAALSACATTPNEPTISASDVNRAFDEATEISNLPLTATANLPTGAVTYTGQLGADVSGDAQGSILGDMTMRVDFADNDIDGSVTNINLIDPNGMPNQRFDGRLDIDGVESSGRLDAFASGEITGVDNDGFEVDSQMLLTLDGDVYDDFDNGDAVFGSAEGTARGDFDMNVDGVFFGTAD